MRIPNYPRVHWCLNMARGFINHYKISHLPVNPLHIIHLNRDWEVRRLREVSTKESPYVMDSEDAETLYFKGLKSNKDKYLIIYNDDIQTPQRIVWSIMHEIAHIVLGHLKDFEKTKIARGHLTKAEKKVLEREADIFTAEVMAPMSILKALRITNYHDIIRYCHLSKEAAKNRINDIIWHGDKRIYSASDPFYYIQFRDYLQRLRVDIEGKISFQDYFPIDSTSQTKLVGLVIEFCSLCGNNRISKFAIFCSMCSEPILSTSKGGQPLQYKEIALDHQGRAVKCPRCANESIDEFTTYCEICGANLLQRCGNPNWHRDGIGGCSNQPAGNARYCKVCGHKTTFFKEDLLPLWEEERKEWEMLEAPF